MNKFEVYGLGEYLHQDNTTFSDPYFGRVTMKMDDTGLGGIGVAYHFNDFLSVRSDFMFGSATLHTLAPDGTGSVQHRRNQLSSKSRPPQSGL